VSQKPQETREETHPRAKITKGLAKCDKNNRKEERRRGNETNTDPYFIYRRGQSPIQRTRTAAPLDFKLRLVQNRVSKATFQATLHKRAGIRAVERERLEGERWR